MNHWKVERKEDVQCSLVKSPTVFIEPVPRAKIELLMDKYQYQEWIGYLVGVKSADGNYLVGDLSIPPHIEVSGVSAEAEPFHIPDKCIGVIHSHNSMGAFHSGVDDDYVDRNFPFSVTVSKVKGKIEFDTVSYQQTPCGRGAMVKGQVKYALPKRLDSTDFLTEATKNIDKGKHTFTLRFTQKGFTKGVVREPIDYYQEFWKEV